MKKNLLFFVLLSLFLIITSCMGSGKSTELASDASGKQAFNDPQHSEIDTASVQKITGNKREISVDGVDFNMVYVEGGLKFKSSTNEAESVTVAQAYEIGETEVTYELWKKVYDWATDPARGSNIYIFGNTGRMGSLENDTQINNQHPVTMVNWKDVVVWTNALTEYYNAVYGTNYACVYTSFNTPIRNSSNTNPAWQVLIGQTPGAKGFRVPLSVEWELAAKYIGTTAPTIAPLATQRTTTIVNGVTYYWTPWDYASGATASANDSLYGYDHGYSRAETDDVAWYSANCGTAVSVNGSTNIVAQKRPNALGLYDMSGNVWEWTAALKGQNDHVIRGGSWMDNVGIMVGIIGAYDTDEQLAGIGFRLARTE